MTFESEHEHDGPVVRDKRRIDPLTGQVREPRDAAAPEPPAEPAANADTSAVAELEVALAERTADLQRLQAEYVNYKRRVDRDRDVVRETAVASVLTSLLPVLDDIGRAREHDELHGGFKAVAESLQRTISGLGLESYGEVGDDFDPRLHEALMHSYTDDVDRPVCQAVLQVGYRIGERIVRPARVAVAEPNDGPAPATDDAPADAGEAGGTAADNGQQNEHDND